MEKIKDLINKEKKVYILLKNDDVAEHFMRAAEAEGILFSDGVKPTQRKVDDIIALNSDGTICYVGYLGRMYRNSEQCICIDYENMINEKC